MTNPPKRDSSAARAAAVRAEQERRERRRQYLVVAGSALALLLIVGVGLVIQQSRDTTGDAAAQTPFPTSSATVSDASVAAADTYGLGVGNPKAKVKVEVFEDFQCPFCREFEALGRDQLRQDAADGKAYIVYRPFAFLNDYSDRALNAFAVVLDTSGPAVALRFHDLLYENQPSETGTSPSDSWLIDKAVQAGADKSAISSAIEKESQKQFVVDANDAASKRHVSSTPTVFVNGTSASGQTIQALVASVQSAVDAGQ